MKKLIALICAFSLLTALPAMADWSHPTLKEKRFNEFTYIIEEDRVKITDCHTTEDTVEIPAEIEGLPVSAIGEAVFNCRNMTKLILPASVTEIYTIAFINNKVLAEIEIDEANTAFCVKDGVVFSKDGETLVFYPVARPDESYTSPEGVKTIAPLAFMDTRNLKSLTIAEGVELLDEGSIGECSSVTELSLPESLREIRQNAIGLKNVENITVPGGVKKLNESSFYFCTGLKNVTISDGVEELEGTVFDHCTHLESVVIPQSVKKYSHRGIIYYCSGSPKDVKIIGGKGTAAKAVADITARAAHHDNAAVTYVDPENLLWQLLNEI